VHYILLWIAYIDDYCGMYSAPKEKNHKYPVRIYWILSEIKYKDAKFMYRWYPAIKQQVGVLIMELGRFFIEECLNGKK